MLAQLFVFFVCHRYVPKAMTPYTCNLLVILNSSPLCTNSGIICIRHRWEGEMGSSQHKSPHQARALRRVLDVVKSAQISPSRRTNDAVCMFSYEYLSEMAKSNCVVKRIGETVRWSDLTIRLVQ